MPILASQKTSFSKVIQLADNVFTPTHKYLGLQSNKVDGTYHSIDPGGSDQIGLWSSALSDSSGNVDTSPQIQNIFDSNFSVAYDNDWDTAPGSYTTTSIVNCQNSILKVTSTNGDPCINMYGLGSWNPNIYRYIAIRYRLAVGSPATKFEIFFCNATYTSANSSAYLDSSNLIADGTWHTYLLDMWQHSLFKTGGNITGWRYDWATASGVTMELDYIRFLSDAVVKNSVHKINITGDSLLNIYPVDFTINLYNGANIVKTLTVIGNTEVSHACILSQVYDCTMLELNVTKINAANNTLKLLEFNVAFQFTTTDNLLAKLTDIASAMHKIPVQDNIQCKLTEVPAIVKVAVKVTDNIIYNVLDMLHYKRFVDDDELKVVTIESQAKIQNFLTDTDNITLSYIELIHYFLNSFIARDNILYKLDDTKHITVNFNTADIVKPMLIDMLLYKRFMNADILEVTEIDGNAKIHNSFIAVDAISLNCIEYIPYFLNSFIARDNIPYHLDENKHITVSFITVDNINHNILDLAVLTNVHTRMNDAVRQIFGKLQILYTDPMFDTQPIISTSSDNRISNKEQVIDGVAGTEQKWFTLHDNKLDGSYHCPDDSSFIGWWGNEISNIDGSFDTPQILTLDFFARPIDKILLYGDDKRPCYPVDFDVILYQDDTIVYTEVVRDNTNPLYLKPINTIGRITKMVAKIYRINMQSVCRITEFFSLVVKDYDMDTIADMHLLEELAYEDTNIPLGAISANELDISLRNVNDVFEISNINSPLYGMLRKNRKVTAWLGVKIKEDIEWHKLGVFWTTEWKCPFSDVNVAITARDVLERMRNDTFTTSQLYVNYNAYQLYEIIFLAFGLTAEQYNIDEVLKNIVIPYAWFDRISYRDAVAKLSSGIIVQVYCDREGVLQVKHLSTTQWWLTQMKMDSSITDFDHPNASLSVTNSVEVLINQLKPGDKTSIYSNTDPIVIPANSVQDITCIYTNIPNQSVDAPVITKDADLTVLGIDTYVWGIIVHVQNNTANALNISNIDVEGIPLQVSGSDSVIVEDSYSILTEGRIQQQVNCDFIQNRDYANLLATDLLKLYSNQKSDITLEDRGDISIGIGDDVSVSTKYEKDKPYTVFRQDLTYDGGLQIDTDGKII